MKLCPICNTKPDIFFEHKIEKTHFREFFKCSKCDFIWVPFEYHISSDLEQKRYEKHKWAEVLIEDFKNQTLSNYDNNLNSIIKEHIIPFIITNLTNHNNSPINHLDYGCGKFPNLSTLLKWNIQNLINSQIDTNQIKFKSFNYDKFYNNSLDLIDNNNFNKYHIITATEVIEHFTQPNENFELLCNLLSNDGILVITTELTTSEIINNFSTWWYKNDITHVSFYSLKTIEYLSHKLKLNLIFSSSNLIILKKK